MIKYYTFVDEQMRAVEHACKDCWINMIHPTDKEINEISEKYQIDVDDLKAALDEEEITRIEVEDNYTLILFDIPTLEERNGKDRYVTIPMGVVLAEGAFITVCLEKTAVLDFDKNKRMTSANPAMKTRFLLQILFNNANFYLKDLKIIYRQSETAQKKLRRSTKNTDLIDMMEIGESLIYFNTSLKAINSLLDKINKTESIKKYEDDTDLLEDVMIENRQALETTEIYSGILNGMMDAFASVINNNMNEVMRFLAVATIVLSIPNIVFGAFGMNLEDLPLESTSGSFWIICIISVALSLLSIVYFRKKKMY